jgi:hypothetical protein
MSEIVGSLVYDSWTEPIPELRASVLRDRHLIYEGGGVILDLLLKQEKESSCIHVGGQVLPGQDTVDRVSDLPVCIEQGRHRCYTHTNALGEFTFHSVPNGTVDLAITLGRRRFIVRGLSNKEPRNWRVVPSMAGGD